jgi:hypothetical protein
LAYVKNDRIFELQSDRGEVERMLKALIKSLENKHLNPRILDPFFQLIGRRPLIIDLTHQAFSGFAFICNGSSTGRTVFLPIGETGSGKKFIDAGK